jgi:arginase family enzyme
VQIRRYEVIKQEIDHLLLREKFTGQYWRLEGFRSDEQYSYLTVPTSDPFFGYVFYDGRPDVAVFGVPYNGGSRFPNSKVGEFPNTLRQASYRLLNRNSYPLPEPLRFIDLDTGGYVYCGNLVDLGNVSCNNVPSERHCLRLLCESLANESIPFVCIGGDHSYTFDIISALRVYGAPITIWQFDAHHDMFYTTAQLDHGNVFAQIADFPFVQNIIQIGGRGVRTPQQLFQHPKVTRIPRSKLYSSLLYELAQRHKDTVNYLSIDMDCLDPCVFPFVDFAVPGGYTLHQLTSAITELFSADIHFVGADIVEGTGGGTIEKGDYDLALYVLIVVLSGLVGQTSTHERKEII